jgi:hypothetical protein
MVHGPVVLVGYHGMKGTFLVEGTCRRRVGVGQAAGGGMSVMGVVMDMAPCLQRQHGT